ncbi:MAG TPA: hypothetical protein VJQ47_09960 [Steroidobacteraceae bacterium]|nr:hypothetical protein [Steroidobacteraceae bacterium]
MLPSLAMPRALTAILLVVGLLIGLILTLRSSSRTGIPSKDVLERAEQRARELEAQERAEDSGRHE